MTCVLAHHHWMARAHSGTTERKVYLRNKMAVFIIPERNVDMLTDVHDPQVPWEQMVL